MTPLQPGVGNLHLLRTLVLDLEKIIFMSTASHLDANCSSKSWRAKKQNHNPQATESDSFPNSAAWVKILSIKLMNRISDRGQLWQSQIFTWNESELFQECSPQGVSGHSIVSLSRSALIGQTPMGLRCSKSRMYKRYAKY